MGDEGAGASDEGAGASSRAAGGSRASAGDDAAPWWARRHRRLRLSPAVPRLLRGSARLQLGSGEGAQVVHGLGPDDWHTVERLARGTTREALEVDCGRRGADPARALRLVGLLAESGALVPDDEPADPARGVAAARLRVEATAWARVWPRAGRSPAGSPVAWPVRERVRRRPGRRAVVVGGGGLGSLVAAGLAASGVARTEHEDDRDVRPCDVVPGGPTVADVATAVGTASAAAVRRVAGDDPALGGGRTAPPDVVVLVRAGAADAAGAFALVQDGVAHLPVVVREGDVVVGPVVVPGRTACLHCLDHHRCDADPDWPAVLRQLLATEPCGVVAVPSLALVASGVATLLALAHLDRRPFAPPGAAARAGLPDGTVTWRCWRPHPRCGCVGLPLDAPVAADGPGVPAADGSATMTA